MSLAELDALFAGPHPAGGSDRAAEFRAQFTAAEWAALQRRPDILAALRLAFEFDQQRVAGIVPGHYTGRTVCQHCGPVWIWAGAPAQVLGCPWCVSRGGGDAR